jgi:amidohydrolase
MPSARHLTIAALVVGAPLQAQAPHRLYTEIDRRVREVESRVVAWRRDIHEHPELSNREVRTAKLVAEHLARLGLDVRTGVAHTGVVGLLRGGKPGRVVALRADMDALPVTEEVNLPFRSRARSTYNGQDVGVMHACGHDTHVAMLMGVAEVLAGLRQELAGTVKFIFQPAEEGVPAGETGGASMMVREGVLQNPAVDAIFGLHVFPFEVGKVSYRSGAIMASSDQFSIIVRGRQTHGAIPWGGVDPIVVASQIVMGIQTITSRQTDLTATPAVITVGLIRGGVRFNIIPDSVEIQGTIRTFDERVRDDIHARLARTAESIAAASAATARVQVQKINPVTSNHVALTERMVPTIKRVLGDDGVSIGRQTTTAEDFAYYQQQVPGLFLFLGITPRGARMDTVAVNHSPRFFADEAALAPGMRVLANLVVDFLK